MPGLKKGPSPFYCLLRFFPFSFRHSHKRVRVWTAKFFFPPCMGVLSSFLRFLLFPKFVRFFVWSLWRCFHFFLPIPAYSLRPHFSLPTSLSIFPAYFYALSVFDWNGFLFTRFKNLLCTSPLPQTFVLSVTCSSWNLVSTAGSLLSTYPYSMKVPCNPLWPNSSFNIFKDSTFFDTRPFATDLLLSPFNPPIFLDSFTPYPDQFFGPVFGGFSPVLPDFSKGACRSFARNAPAASSITSSVFSAGQAGPPCLFSFLTGPPPFFTPTLPISEFVEGLPGGPFLFPTTLLLITPFCTDSFWLPPLFPVSLLERHGPLLFSLFPSEKGLPFGNSSLTLFFFLNGHGTRRRVPFPPPRSCSLNVVCLLYRHP